MMPYTILSKLLKRFSLNVGENEKQNAIESFKKEVSFSETKVWMLVCAIVIASIGLNVNSTAVIIGAMLISPIMDSLIVLGLSLGIYDFKLLRKTLLSFTISTTVSLIVATLYFYISPFKDMQSELLARTTPNIYDVFIAFFGGIAGVIASIRPKKSNPIAGVAIATALMPPLCTAGYGLAAGSMKYFMGALYLYGINSIFIFIATYLVVKYLRFPVVEIPNTKYNLGIRITILALVSLMVIPSLFFATNLYTKHVYEKNVELMVAEEFVKKGYVIVHKHIIYGEENKTIEIALLRKNFTDEEIKELELKLSYYKLEDTKISIKKNTSDDLNKFRNDVLGMIEQDKNIYNLQKLHIKDLQQELQRNKVNNKQLLKEVELIYPSIYLMSVETHSVASVDSVYDAVLVYYDSRKKLKNAEKEKLTNWLKTRLQNDSVILVAKNY